MPRFALLVSIIPWILSAQLPGPNQAGVAMGHVHFRVRDVEAQKKFWVEVLEASASKLGSMEMMKLPGTIVLFQAGEPAGGTKGSVVDHLAFKVRDLDGALGKAKALKINFTRGSTESAMVEAPEGIWVELIQDRSLATAAVNHHIHFHHENFMEMRAWYGKVFGARLGMRGKIQAADLPGVNLSFEAPKVPVGPTKGRALDHIGFEVRGLEAFAKKLEAQGIKLDVPYRKVPSLGIALVFITDPWGTYIELTEGLDRL
jgi:catechol 2,3-dioxygenase-like lactoylglutathione lyase family enzyme